MIEDKSSNGLGQPRDRTIVRFPSIKVTVDKWDWNREQLVGTINLTKAVTQYRFQKSLHNPASQCQLTILPQNDTRHYLDDLQTLDVVRIYEFDTLKFQGYIRKIGSAGWKDQNGNPHRTAEIVVVGFGGYFTETKLSINMSLLRRNLDWVVAAEKLAKDLLDLGDAPTLRGMSDLLITSWFDFISKSVDSSIHTTYFGRYVDSSTGVSSGESPGYPRELFLYYGEEDEVDLWGVLQKLTEAPLNEFFLDEGPRDIHIAGEDVRLDQEKTYLIGRPTPFDGSVDNGVSSDPFKVMSELVLPLPYLTRYNLNKGMDDVYSVYLTAPSVFDLSKLELIAEGRQEIDSLAYKKYLYRLHNKSLYYVRFQKKKATEIEGDAPKISLRADDVSKTFKNWYEHNDQFLSGSVEYTVPANSNIDPRVGMRFGIEGTRASYYIEGITHQWTYGGPLSAVATVTRGWNVVADKPIELKDRIFKKAKTAYWVVETDEDYRNA